MSRQNHHHSQATHTAPQISHSTAPQSTSLAPHPYSHAYSAYRSSRQRPAYREKGRHATPRSSEYEARNCVLTGVSHSSSPERRIPRYFGLQHQITDPPSSAHRSHANNGEPHEGSRRDSDHLHDQGCPSSHDLPHFNNSAEVVDYIRAWKDKLQAATPLDASCVVPASPVMLAPSLPKTRQ